MFPMDRCIFWGTNRKPTYLLLRFLVGGDRGHPTFVGSSIDKILKRDRGIGRKLLYAFCRTPPEGTPCSTLECSNASCSVSH